MMMKNLQNNKTYQNHETRRGFVILFAVTISAIVLSIALGVANIALKEIKFGTNARDTNDAFFAADTGAEKALFNDKTPSNYPPPAVGFSQTWNFSISSLGSRNSSCVSVIVKKENQISPSTELVTTITSKGYNIGDSNCDSSNSDRIEREIEVTY